MTRSHRHAPVYGRASDRAGWYKRFRAHLERARLLSRLRHGDYEGLEFELAPWNEYDCPRDGKKWDPDWFNGEVIPRWWDRRINGAYAARIKEFDPDLAKKRRSK